MKVSILVRTWPAVIAHAPQLWLSLLSATVASQSAITHMDFVHDANGISLYRFQIRTLETSPSFPTLMTFADSKRISGEQWIPVANNHSSIHKLESCIKSFVKSEIHFPLGLLPQRHSIMSTISYYTHHFNLCLLIPDET